MITDCIWFLPISIYWGLFHGLACRQSGAHPAHHTAPRRSPPGQVVPQPLTPLAPPQDLVPPAPRRHSWTQVRPTVAGPEWPTTPWSPISSFPSWHLLCEYEFNSDDHYIYHCGQESLRRNGGTLTVKKRVRNAVLGCNLKNERMISVCFQGKPFNIQVYAPTTDAEEAEVERFYEDQQDLLEITPSKNVLFIIGDLNAKVGSPEIPGVTSKFGLGVQNEKWQGLIRILPREHTGHSQHPIPTTREKTLHMDITRWSIPKSNWLYSLQ